MSRLLRQDETRLVTLTGPGGVGKTRLALKVVEELAQDFADGTAAVSLAPIREPDLVLTAIAQALGIRDAPGQPIAQRLADTLHDREMLLLLDNFEQLVEAGSDIAALLSACPRLRALVTSRTVLHLTGEHDVAVGPLELPALGSNPPLERVAEASAVQLFAQRAHAAASDFRLTEANAQIAVGICRQVDSLPLAIELAAARVVHLSLPALLDRLERRLPLLTGGARDQPSRKQTMRNTITWSYDLLSAEEQLVFRRLGVFVGGFTLKAAEQVAVDSPADALDVISSLVDKSLLRREASRVGEPRYAMLETVHEFAIDQLKAHGEEMHASTRHAAYFDELAKRAAPNFYGDEDEARLAQLADERPNLRAATIWALTNEQAELAVRLVHGTRNFMISTNPQEALHWLEVVLSVPELDPLARADALWMAATLTLLVDLARGAALADESRAIAAVHGDRLREIRALDIRATAAEWNGEFDQANAFHQEGLAIMRELPDDPEVQRLRAWFVCNLADGHVWRHDPALAIPLADEALAWWRQAGLAWAIPAALQTLGAACSMMGDQRSAAGHYGEALSRRIELGDRSGWTAGILDGCAGVAAGLEKLPQAVMLLGAAAAMRDKLGIRYGPHWLRGKQVREAVQSRMTTSDFSAAWEAGQSLTDQQAIDQARQVLAEAQEPDEAPQSPAGLSPRELEVLALLVEGRSNPQIGDALFISPRTVQNHVTSILGKLGVASRTEAAARSVREGLV